MSEALYQALVLKAGQHPHYAGRPLEFDALGQTENRMCGDSVQVFYTQAQQSWRHEAQGCAILLASAEFMCAAAAGKTADELQHLHHQFENLVKTGEENPDLGDLNALAGIAHYPARLRCATLPWDALANALAGTSAGVRANG